MLGLAAESLAPIVLMHMKGTPQTMNSLAAYDDVVEEVAQHLLRRRSAAEAAGVPGWNVLRSRRRFRTRVERRPYGRTVPRAVPGWTPASASPRVWSTT